MGSLCPLESTFSSLAGENRAKEANAVMTLNSFWLKLKVSS